MCGKRMVLIVLLVLHNAGLGLGGENTETCTKNVVADNLEHVVKMSSGTMAQNIADAKHGVLLVYYYGASVCLCFLRVALNDGNKQTYGGIITVVFTLCTRLTFVM
eukprot:SAG31_NODE_1_length_62978_cov_30.836130_8_plen_106_part_00